MIAKQVLIVTKVNVLRKNKTESDIQIKSISDKNKYAYLKRGDAARPLTIAPSVAREASIRASQICP